ncbi:MAG: hypothetical protein AAF720_02680 [Pseudomonadota bacterium]
MFFKLIHGDDPERWGAIGFSQSPGYCNSADRVLLGVSKTAPGKHPLRGKIFGWCTFHVCQHALRDLACPDMRALHPHVEEKWPIGIPIKDYQRFAAGHEFNYSEVDVLARRARHNLVRVYDMEEVIEQIPATPVAVQYQSPSLRLYLKSFDRVVPLSNGDSIEARP